MSRYASIREFLRRYSNGKYRFSDIEYAPESDCYLIVLPTKIRISDHAKKMLSRRLETDLDAKTKIVQRQIVNILELSNEIRELLASKLPEIEDVLVSGGSDRITVFLLMPDSTNIEELSADSSIQRSLRQFLRKKKLQLDEYFISSIHIEAPSDTQILKAIARHAPVSMANLVALIDDEDTAVPSANWMQRALDRLRRGGFIIWQKNDTYAITAKGLSAFPQLKGRRSPNIVRALELGRRKW